MYVVCLKFLLRSGNGLAAALQRGMLNAVVFAAAVLAMLFGSLSGARAAGDGLTQATAFTQFQDALNVTTPGYYWYNLNGYVFRTWTRDKGYILILRDFGGATGAQLPYAQDMSTLGGARGIIPQLAMNSLTDIGTVRFITDDPNDANKNIDATTTNATILTRVTKNQTLHKGYVDITPNLDWVGLNADRLFGTDTTCSGTNITLSKLIFNACGSTSLNTTYFWPTSGYHRSTTTLGEISSAGVMELWARYGTEAPPPPATIAIDKTADFTLNVNAGQVVTYSYVITNTSTVPLTDITLNDVHGGTGPFAGPDIESASIVYDDPTATNDSVNTDTVNGTWDVLGPGDQLKVTATYTVTQQDIEQLQ